MVRFGQSNIQVQEHPNEGARIAAAGHVLGSFGRQSNLNGKEVAPLCALHVDGSDDRVAHFGLSPRSSTSPLNASSVSMRKVRPAGRQNRLIARASAWDLRTFTRTVPRTTLSFRCPTDWDDCRPGRPNLMGADALERAGIRCAPRLVASAKMPASMAKYSLGCRPCGRVN